MKVTSSLATLLMGEGQPYSEVIKIPCDIILDIVESKLDEGLSYLEGDNARLARKQIQIEKEFGSVGEFVKEAMQTRSKFNDILLP